MAEGYTRPTPATSASASAPSGPAGTDMITGLYSAIGDSIPIPVHHRPGADRGDPQGRTSRPSTSPSIAKPVTKMAVTVLEAAQVPGASSSRRSTWMRSARPGPVLIDLPIDVQMTEIEFDPDTYEPLPVYKPAASRAQIEKAIGLLNASERPLIVAGGGVINADAADLLVEFAELTGTPVVPTLMGWGLLPDDHELNAGMVGLQTSHRYGNATFLESDFVLGIGNRWANRHTGQARRLHRRPQVRPRRRRADLDRQDLRPGLRHRLRREGGPGAVRRGGEGAEGGRQAARPLRVGAASAQEKKATLQRRTHFDDIPTGAAARLRGDEQGLRPGDLVRLHHRPLPDRRRPDAARLPSAALDQLRPGRPARLDRPGRARASPRPTRTRRSWRSPATTTSSS